MLKQRIITASVILAALTAVLIIGKYAFFVFVLIFAVGAMYEYNALVMNDKRIKSAILPCLMTAAIMLSSAFLPQYTYAVFVLCAFALFIRHLVEKSAVEAKADHCVYSIWGLMYIGLFMALASRLIFAPYGYYVILPTILAVVTCDSAAYFIGTRFGKHKLCPSISPNKSVEGAVAGFVTAAVVFACTLFAAKDVHFANKTLFYLTGGAVIGIVGQLGDLAASLIKRKYKVKDFGNIFPGHGGFLDRIDSELFSLAAVYYLAQTLIKII